MEEEHERWRQELGWTEEQVQEEADRLFELKENRRGKLYRRLKPYMFWRAIFVSKVQTAFQEEKHTCASLFLRMTYNAKT